MTENELYSLIDKITECENALQNREDKISSMADYLTRLEVMKDIANGNVRSATQYENVIVVQDNDYKWGVVKTDGSIVVPFGKYGWIDGFDSGLARVRTHEHIGYAGRTIAVVDLNGDHPIIKGQENIQRYYDEDKLLHPDKYAKWGIINEDGEEVLPVKYNKVWNFLGKNRNSTTVEINGDTEEIWFHDLNPKLERSLKTYNYNYRNDDEDDYGTHYGKYAGTYAQDVAGYSDDVINDAFEGDPDAYWNID